MAAKELPQTKQLGNIQDLIYIELLFKFLLISYFSILDISDLDLTMNAPTKHILLKVLADISNLWCEIGLSLAVSDNVLDSLKRSRESDVMKLSTVIDSWLTSTQSSLVTWETVITAIKNPIVNHVQKANELYQHLTKGNFYISFIHEVIKDIFIS